MRRVVMTALAGLFLAVSAMPAGAATKTVMVVNFAFNPQSMKIAQGDTVFWQNTDTTAHTATQDAPLSLFNTGSIGTGTTSLGKTITAAGVYPYHCTIHPGMVGSIKVPIKVAPTTGTTATTFTVTLATVAAPTNFVYDVQQKIGTGPWAAWKTGVTTATTTFKATTAGTFTFRSMLRKVSSGAKSKPSPGKAITVS